MNSKPDWKTSGLDNNRVFEHDAYCTTFYETRLQPKGHSSLYEQQKLLMWWNFFYVLEWFIFVINISEWKDTIKWHYWSKLATSQRLDNKRVLKMTSVRISVKPLDWSALHSADNRLTEQKQFEWSDWLRLSWQAIIVCLCLTCQRAAASN